MRKWFVDNLDDEDLEENIYLLQENAFDLFSKSKRYGELSDWLKKSARIELDMFIELCYLYPGTRPEELMEEELDELLFQVFPAKLSYEKDDYIEALEIIKSFLIFMEEDGYHPDSKDLAKYIDDNYKEIMMEFNNPDNFGMAKGLFSSMNLDLNQLTTEGDISGFIDNFNQLSYEERSKLLNLPIPEEKIPRNAPCPCGSGKKYKQCCGA